MVGYIRRIGHARGDTCEGRIGARGVNAVRGGHDGGLGVERGNVALSGTERDERAVAVNRGSISRGDGQERAGVGPRAEPTGWISWSCETRRRR